MCASARALSPISSWLVSCTLLAPAPRPMIYPYTRGISPSSYLPLSTWQGASAFNQPLSLDTSRVMDMGYMFYVRLRACPVPNLQLARLLHPACARTSPHDLPTHTRSISPCFCECVPFPLGSMQVGYPLATSSSPAAHGQAVLLSSLHTAQPGVIWAHAPSQQAPP